MFEQAKVSGVLALRGDRIDGAEPAGVFEHASDLAVYIRQQRPDMKIYGACYPEKHPQSATLEEDIDNLKKKVDAGVTHLISQLFYDNEDFLRFLDKARAAGIDVPIEAGIMPVMNAKSVLNMSNKCQSKVPEKLGIMLDKWGGDKALLKEAGIAYASEQICELVARGVDGVHLYTMNHHVSADAFGPTSNHSSSDFRRCNKHQGWLRVFRNALGFISGYYRNHDFHATQVRGA